MLENLPKYPKLLIVSDTPMWQTAEGVMVFEPTLREVEWLAEMFEIVTWIGYGHLNKPKSFARLTTRSNIHFIVLPYAVGGSSLIKKLGILRFIPGMMFTILGQIRKHSRIHTRGPSVPAIIAILISYVNGSRQYWHKYAGNWKQNPAPWAYALQRFLLKHNSHRVTVNGKWSGEPVNITNLENPCFTEDELVVANKDATEKSWKSKINICFVGALISAKGIHQFIDSLFKVTEIGKIGTIFIAGDGIERNALEVKAAALPVEIKFSGNLQRKELNEVYKYSHIIVLPSETEGFPKVIAEAASFGCVPVVSDVSSLGQYIHDGMNGRLLKNIESKTIAEAIDALLGDNQKLMTMAKEVTTLAPLFTYDRYCAYVREEIFKA